MNDRTLFLAWQDQRQEQRRPTREWFPIGRLDIDAAASRYRFRYIHGARRAAETAGFEPLLDFPTLDRNYESSELFPLFKNRILSNKRKDFSRYAETLDLPPTVEPIDMLNVDGGLRETDNFEVFPKIETETDGSFVARFFLHGWRHVNAASQERLAKLVRGEELYIAIELTNPVTQLAVQIQTLDYHMIGWAPRYLVEDLAAAIAETGRYEASVVRLNPVPAPSKQRLLIELKGHLGQYTPMNSPDYKPLVA